VRAEVIHEHRAYDALLTAAEIGKVSRERIADVLIRMMVAAPKMPSQSEIAQGEMLLMPSGVAADSVSRAVAGLRGLGMLADAPGTVGDRRRGRPMNRLRLNQHDWAMIGAKIEHVDAETVAVHVLVTGLDAVPLEIRGYQSSENPYTRTMSSTGDYLILLADMIEELHAQPPVDGMTLLGVGVDIAGHVNAGRIIAATIPAGGADRVGRPAPPGPHAQDVTHGQGEDPPSFSERLGARLDHLADPLNERIDAAGAPRGEDRGGQDRGGQDRGGADGGGADGGGEPGAGRVPLPVILDNDTNMLAVLETYVPRFPDRDLVLVSVFPEGIGSALVVEGRVYRGARGMAGEIGHCVVPFTELAGDLPTTGSAGSYRSFDAQCHCGRTGHLDCYATPERIKLRLGEPTLERPAYRPAEVDGRLTEEGLVFTMAGRALGIGIANLVNVVNPSRVLLLFPAELYERARHSAAERYWLGLWEMWQRHAFSDAARYTEISVEKLEQREVRFLGTKASSLRVLDAMVQHAKRQCRCYVPGRRADWEVVARPGPAPMGFSYRTTGSGL
jgi:predicted NBD/HSP70 family sugar kinase